ncbi:hypothetical protein DP0356 [Desulfotalea psychrophila LSv54]|uniref:Permease n=1 Tax=Desulfotalea psychrophila (strain LSv54 / DSM 12343) TaxID=177439 RepID=Q6ARD9_DESPS|nr:hypothetical protein DP0356 [Desulfotalea psychrophila LSv54]
MTTSRARTVLSPTFLLLFFGSITPFCSCNSIPLFLGFTAARIPVGITVAFLITSPIINEVAIVLLGSVLGIKFMIAYLIVAISAGARGGFFFDLIKAERFISPMVVTPAPAMAATSSCKSSRSPPTTPGRADICLPNVRQKKLCRRFGNGSSSALQLLLFSTDLSRFWSSSLSQAGYLTPLPPCYGYDEGKGPAFPFARYTSPIFSKLFFLQALNLVGQPLTGRRRTL